MHAFYITRWYYRGLDSQAKACQGVNTVEVLLDDARKT